MYPHHISAMVKAVGDALGLDERGRDAVKAALVGYWHDKIAITWSIEDVRSCKPGIADDDAIDALQRVLDDNDASRGVTWDTIADACDGEYPTPESLDNDNEDENENNDGDEAI